MNFQFAALNFATAATYNIGMDGSFSVAVGDVNSDGKPDLLVATRCYDFHCTSGGVGVLLGNGDGTFQPAVSYGSGGYEAASVALADVNGDGNPDLVVANYYASASNLGSGAIGVLLGNGDGTFQAAVSYGSTSGYNQYSVAVGDVNGDGKLDVVVGNYCSTSICANTAGVLMGNGDGSFQPAVPYGAGGYLGPSVALGDVNGDGKVDIVIANYYGDSSLTSPGPVGVLLNNGDGTFQTAVTYTSGGYFASSVAVGDVNGDGKLDLVVANSSDNNSGIGTVGVLLGNGDGTFQPAVSYGSGGSGGTSVAIGDFDGDGKQDIVVANEYDCNTPCGVGGVGVLLGNGDGSFQTAQAFGSGGYDALSVATGDVNADGKTDLLVTNYCLSLDDCASSSVDVLINTSTFATTTTISSSPNPSNVGQSVAFTATVTPQGKGTPTGTVSFLDGTTNLGNATLSSSGVAALTISTLAVGSHNLTATYSGDQNFAASTSSILVQVVEGTTAVLSPASINFGNEAVGMASAPQTLTLTNTGAGVLGISGIALTGINAVDFAETNTCGATLGAGSSCTISVTFTPTATGLRSASLTVTDDAIGGTQSAALSGVGVTPAVSLSPTSLTFGTQLIRTTSAAQVLTLTNTGTATLTITSLIFTGINPADFAQTNTCGASVSPGASCTITVTFAPRAINLRTASLSVADNATGSPQTVSVKGTGTQVKLSPTSLNFGSVKVGKKSIAQTIIVTNAGSTSLSITGIGITGTNFADFSETTTCGSSLAAGKNCSISVTFAPKATGKRTASVTVTDNGGGSPQKVTLTGTGT
jgi:hypothetical protein